MGVYIPESIVAMTGDAADRLLKQGDADAALLYCSGELGGSQSIGLTTAVAGVAQEHEGQSGKDDAGADGRHNGRAGVLLLLLLVFICH